MFDSVAYMADVISITGLVKRFGTTAALDDSAATSATFWRLPFE